MATITITYPNDQHNNWATGISIPANSYISSISISCPYVFQDNTSAGCTLYIGGVQLATVAAGHYGSLYGSASGNITGTTITCNRGEFSFRSEVTITYTITSSVTSRTITKKVSPSGGGSVSTKISGSEVSSATKGQTVNASASASSGYVFKDWTTSPANLLGSSSSGNFTMPDQNVTVTANFWKLSTGSLSSKSLTGGGTVTLTITRQSSSLTHKYRVNFGTGMTSSWTDATTSATISVPLNWSASIPNATSKTGGTLELRTYSGSTLLGTTTITGLTYNVPSSVVPTIGTITTSIERTINSKTYGNIGDIYAQSHCGVRVQATASGAQSSTITGTSVQIGSYTGGKYRKTYTTASIDFTSGLLTVAGSTTITVTATDSRGRTATKTATITVSAYTAPSGTLQVWRVDSLGDPDDMGIYGEYELTKQYSDIGNNSLTVTLSVSGDSVSSPADSGDLLPGNRIAFSETQEYLVTLTLADGLETTVITDNLPSARFIMAFDASGNKIGVMKFPNQAIPAGKMRTFEISGDTQVYIGNDKLVDCHIDEYVTTLENAYIEDDNGGHVFKCGNVAHVCFRGLTATNTSATSWETVATLPAEAIPMFQQLGCLMNDTTYTTDGHTVYEMRVTALGQIQIWRPQTGVKMWGGMTYICV